MAPDGSDELLVTIAPHPAPAVPEPARWLGPLLIIGLPAALAVAVFAAVALSAR